MKIEEELPEDVTKMYIGIRRLPDGRIIGVHRLLYHWTMHVDIDEIGYADKDCYQTQEQALLAMLTWDGIGEPGYGWHRHLKTGRRRPDGDPTKEYIAW